MLPLGMPNAYVEARGARDHYAVECLIGEPIHAPSIDRAALGLQAEAAGLGGSLSPNLENNPCRLSWSSTRLVSLPMPLKRFNQPALEARGVAPRSASSES